MEEIRFYCLLTNIVDGRFKTFLEISTEELLQSYLIFNHLWQSCPLPPTLKKFNNWIWKSAQFVAVVIVERSDMDSQRKEAFSTTLVTIRRHCLQQTCWWPRREAKSKPCMRLHILTALSLNLMHVTKSSLDSRVLWLHKLPPTPPFPGPEGDRGW